jgi:crossover junction endodeoxyribonuclease RuvC
MSITIRIIGIDPGLNHTGWGIIDMQGQSLRFVGCGALHTRADDPLPVRLLAIHEGLRAIIRAHAPAEAAIEETFVNRDARATLKLGHARGAAMLAAAACGLAIAEYAPNRVKKAIVGAGHAGKRQVAHMVRVLLPKARPENADAADALAVAICHAHHRDALPGMATVSGRTP